MRNIFILYIPPGNGEAMVHYEDTIRRKVSPERIYAHVDASLKQSLGSTFQGRPIAVWGSRDSVKNRTLFERMKVGDEILIVEGRVIRLLGRVGGKTISADLSRELWKDLRGEQGVPWSLVYFIANPREIDLPFSEFCRLIGYKEDYQLRGFTTVTAELLEAFYEQYEDLYSVLIRMREKEPVIKMVVEEPPTNAEPPEKEDLVVAGEGANPGPDEAEAEPPEHLRIQYQLLKMGREAGEKVWAPRGDQSRLTSRFQFKDFEETFAAGLDTQVRYVENIDVVWKAEFRIDAAFEVENSTSIYSGLLRFADLTMVAPNTIYPMFIVAPSERRNRVREQLARPTFRHLHLAENVRYLSYEKVAEIRDFFPEGAPGLSVDVFVGKGEKLAV
jgi:hypothetical protein